MNKDKLQGLMWGSLLGDAYSNNKALSLYGEQSIWLLEYMSESKVYDPFVYGDIWQKKMNAYQGKLDKASKDTLINIKSGRSFLAAGSSSHDLSVLGRHAPILFTLKGMDEMLESVKFHNCLTHMNKETIEASKYIAEVTLAMIYNLDVENTLLERAKFYGEMVEEEVEKALALKDKPSNVAMKTLGTGSNVEGALASTIYLLLNYHNDFETLLEVNLDAGGDSAARAMVAGMVIGARYGFEKIKPEWIEDIEAYEHINRLIS
jgi:ADP-ribosylglycohydrolase